MHLPVLVVSQRILLQTFLHGIVIDNHLLTGVRSDDKLQNVKQLARITTTISYQRISLLQANIPLGELRVCGDGTLYKRQQVVFVERL